MIPSIRFFFEGVPCILNQKRKHQAWIKEVIRQEGREPGTVNFIFCTDQDLLEMNRLYLEHDTFTDVISFDLSDPSSVTALVDGEVYISLDRVKENAQLFNVSVNEEIRRVMVHGILHLLGYDDVTPALKKAMKVKEDHYLQQF